MRFTAINGLKTRANKRLLSGLAKRIWLVDNFVHMSTFFNFCVAINTLNLEMLRRKKSIFPIISMSCKWFLILYNRKPSEIVRTKFLLISKSRNHVL